MTGLILSILVFNFVAFATNKNLTKNQIVHIWLFTIALQTSFDVYIDFKLHGYWYFTKAVDFWELPTTVLLVPPVNMMFLNWYPFQTQILRQFFYFFSWVTAIVFYEKLTLLPPPIGYFDYGWWTIWHSVLINPLLLFILLQFYKWIRRLEKEAYWDKN